MPASERRPSVGDEDSDLGSRLRAARQRKGTSLATLAKQTSLTKGFLSQLERGLSRASVASLTRICAALDVAPGAILDPLPPGPVAPTDAPALSFGGVGAQDRLLTPPGFSGFQIFHATVQPGGHSSGSATHQPQESHFVFVLRGRFTVTLNGGTHQLRAGESLTFRGSDTYGWSNPSAQSPCEVLWALSPPQI